MNTKIYTVAWWGVQERRKKDFKKLETAMRFINKLQADNPDRNLGLRLIEYTYDERSDEYIITCDVQE